MMRKITPPFQVRELKEDNLVVKQKSLLAAAELMSTPLGLVQCISNGITPTLVVLLEVCMSCPF
jgi:hypothetical protein